MTELLRLIPEFFITGLLAFGGGMATLPFLYDMGARTGWFTGNDVLQMLAVSEATPGPIGVNMATYVGFTVLSAYGIFGAVLGGVVATFSLVLPSVIVIIIISKLLVKFKNSVVVDSVFLALRPASLALIAASGLSVMASTLLNLPADFSLSQISGVGAAASLVDLKALILAVLLFVGMRIFKKLHPVIFIALSAVVGIVFSM